MKAAAGLSKEPNYFGGSAMKTLLSAHDLLHRAGSAVGATLDLALTDLKLTSRQLLVLTAVSDKHGCSQMGLVQATGIDRSTMADVVRRLTKKDLLQRLRDTKDRRAYSITLTEMGHRQLLEATRIATKVERALFHSLLGDDGTTLIQYLRRVVADNQHHQATGLG